jgi:hypothetical protein
LLIFHTASGLGGSAGIKAEIMVDISLRYDEKYIFGVI